MDNDYVCTTVGVVEDFTVLSQEDQNDNPSSAFMHKIRRIRFPLCFISQLLWINLLATLSPFTAGWQADVIH